jgi:hypothetical protein
MAEPLKVTNSSTGAGRGVLDTEYLGISQIAGERNVDNAATSYLAVHEQWTYAVVDLSTDSTVVSAVPSILGAVWVITVLSAHACPIQDDTTEIFSVPASAAVGLFYEFAKGTRCETNLTVDPDNAATGTIVVQYRVI